MTKIPNYSELELEVILDSTVVVPSNITQSVFENRLRDNSKLTWKLNPFLQRENKLALILDSSKIETWKILKRLNWLVAIFIVCSSLWMDNYNLLWTLLILLLFRGSGQLDYWIVLFNCVVIFVIKYFFGLQSGIFWFMFSTGLVTFLISKLAFEYIMRSIFSVAFNDLNTFWKYYVNKLIYIDSTRVNNEFQNLVLHFPELQT